jgi:quercetin dioxygenase-like cupin family protein
MREAFQGGVKFRATDVEATEYLPNRGVFLAGMLGKGRGDGFGLYFGRIAPGSAISPETHPDTTETVYILAGEAIGLLGAQEIPLTQGEVLHVDRNVPHGLRNAGSQTLEFLVIGHPDF